MMIVRGTVAFDIDGVLADFEDRYCQEFGYENRHLYKLEERLEGDERAIQKATKFARDPNIYYGLEPVEGGIEFLRSFMEHGYYVIIATSRPKVCENVTRRWLLRYCVPYMKLAFVNSKAKELNELGQLLSYLNTSILVDDNPGVLEECQNYYINPLCWKQPWNEHFFPKVWWENGKVVFQKFDETHNIEEYWKD